MLISAAPCGPARVAVGGDRIPGDRTDAHDRVSDSQAAHHPDRTTGYAGAVACLLSWFAGPYAAHAIDRAKAWLSRGAREFAVRGFAAVGALLILKDLTGLVG